MPKAICVKKCQYAYGECKTGIIRFHPRHIHSDLLITDKGYYLCYNGRLLTVNDRICERCGTELKLNHQNSTTKLLSYECPNCGHKIKMDL